MSDQHRDRAARFIGIRPECQHEYKDAIGRLAQQFAEVSIEANEAFRPDLDAGREWMRQAWHELNAIRARDGAPPGVSHEWFGSLVDDLGKLLGTAGLPWMVGAARALVRPYEQRISELEAKLAAREDEIMKLQMGVDR